MSEKEMFQEYNEIINKMLWKYNRNMWDDLRSEAYLKFTWLRDNYDPNKGRFFSLAYKTIQMQMMYYVHKEKNSGARPYIFNTLDNYIGGDDGSTFLDVIIDNSDFEFDFVVRDYLEKNLNHGSDFERTVKRLYYIDGYSESDIVLSLGLRNSHPHDRVKLWKALIMWVN